MITVSDRLKTACKGLKGGLTCGQAILSAYENELQIDSYGYDLLYHQLGDEKTEFGKCGVLIAASAIFAVLHQDNEHDILEEIDYVEGVFRKEFSNTCSQDCSKHACEMRTKDVIILMENIMR